MRIGPRTRLVGIFGDPVAHSRSPAMHNAAFAALGLDWVYLPFRVRPEDLRAALDAVRALGLAGVNLTVPHKERARPWLDSLSARAEQTGAVNTVVNRHGHLHGDNTDIAGFLHALRSAGFRPRGRRAVVIGAGGTACSIVAALAAAGAGTIRLANRTPQRARALAQRFAQTRAVIEPIPLAALAGAAPLLDADLVINATSLGWRGERFPPLRYAATPRDCLFYDLVYGRRTDFMRRAERAGRGVVDGTEMLLHQGARAFTLWTRRRAPVPAMRAALRGAGDSD